VDHEQLEENLSLYALGALDPDAVREMEQHLAAGCSACSILLGQYQSAVTNLPYALRTQTPPPALKSRIMTALSGRAATTTPSLKEETPASPVPIPTAPPDLAPPPASSWIPKVLPERRPVPRPIPRRNEFLQRLDRFRAASPALTATLGALLLAVGGFATYLYTTLQAERTATAQERAEAAQRKQAIVDLKTQLEEKQAALTKATNEAKRAVEALGTTHQLLAQNEEQLETLKAQLPPGRGAKDRSRTEAVQAGSDDLVRILTSPIAKMASLSGTDKAKEAYGMVFVEPGTGRGFLYANNLPPLPTGKTYQLWIITNKPISAGVFTLDHGHKGRLLLRDIPGVSQIKKFAITLEPAGGRPQPTGSIYLAGDL